MSVTFQKQLIFRAIRVRYLGQTTHKPARLAVSSGKVRKIYSYGSFEGDQYEEAVRAFCTDLKWSGTLAGGRLTEDEQVYVFTD